MIPNREAIIKDWETEWWRKKEEHDSLIEKANILLKDQHERPWLRKPQYTQRGWWLFKYWYWSCPICNSEMNEHTLAHKFGFDYILVCSNCDYEFLIVTGKRRPKTI